jgi:uncharacterized protein YhaN
MTEEVEGDPLPTILLAIEELKRSNEEVKASNVELIAELAEVKAQLTEMVVTTNNGSGSGRSLQQSYASGLTRSTDLSIQANQPAAAAASFINNKLYCTIDTSINTSLRDFIIKSLNIPF